VGNGDNTKPNLNNPFAQLLEMLNQRTDETTSSFSLKPSKKNPIWKKIVKNTEGPLRQILNDKLTDERTKLPLRFF
jgi:hypothetical protein